MLNLGANNMHRMLATYDGQYIKGPDISHSGAGSNMQHNNMMSGNMQERPQHYAADTEPTPHYTLME